MHFKKRTIAETPLDNKTVLVRVDYNVPLDKNGKITDDFRIKASLETIRALKKRGCKIVLISHLGRPHRKEQKFSLEPAADRLAKLLKEDVRFVSDCFGDKVKMAVKRAPKNSIIMLENLRFYEQEKANDETFARDIAKSSGAKYFVQNGFGVVHRAHASTDAITHFLPSVAGCLLEKEYSTITSSIAKPKRPLVAIIGGAKISDKIELIERFVDKADRIIIGGAMANTFLYEKNISIGKSKFEDDQTETIKRIYDKVKTKVGNGKISDFLVLPIDVAVGKSVDESAKREIRLLADIKSDDHILDIGDASIERAMDIVAHAGTVIWNGTLGMAELPNFAHGSARVALALATHPKITSIIGGGDTADFVLHWDSREGESFSWVSTGGGASMELMAGKKLPGVEALLDAPK